MSVYLSPPRSGVATHPSTPHSANPAAQPATPVSEMTLPTSIFPPPSFPQPEPAHLQRDLLVLTSFNDNTTLRWRPSWFPALISPLELWSLHNPPDVVTEPLPKVRGGIQHFTRRMRRPSDPAPRYIKTWLHWHQYCKLYSIPVDFLSEEHVKVLQMGLVRDAEGVVCAPPLYPLYPEPPMQGRYALPAEVCETHLPRRFTPVGREVVVVKSSGKITIEADEIDAVFQSTSRVYRWSYMPWTAAMEESTRPLKLKLRLWNAGKEIMAGRQ